MQPNPLYTVADDSLAGQFIKNCPHWQAYTNHQFVEQLCTGSLPRPCFEHYLIQDYLFLIHFSRAWALAAFKAQTIEEIRGCTATLNALINDEISLHVKYCAGYGLTESQLTATAAHPANLAYTSYVMERGLAGDLLDLLVALAPCVIGYGEIGARLSKTNLDADHPYKAWIDMYSGAEYLEVVRLASTQLERVAKSRLGGRAQELQSIFDTATRLEVDFWAMGMNPHKR